MMGMRWFWFQLCTEVNHAPAKIITLTTDFGLKDPYVAEMKAAILSICPTVVIVDVSHEIEKFNVRMGAYILASAASYFPKGTVHVAVVDPGVGTRRRALLVQTKLGFFLGPDNGLLALAAEKQGIMAIHEITNPKLMLPEVSSTFHGRDLFAPAAAHVASGVASTEFGAEVRDFVKPSFAKITRDKDVMTGEVLHVDHFGNVITNLSKGEADKLSTRGMVKVEVGRFKSKLKLLRTYGGTKQGEPLALIGSHGYLEIAVNQGNAAGMFQVKSGDRVSISKP